MDGSFASTLDHPARVRTGAVADREAAPDFDPTALMVRVKASRDRDAFQALFLYFAPRVKTYLIRQGASASQAEELAQEALLIVWREADRFEPGRASVAGWIFTIARNLRIDVLRRERSALAYTFAVIDPEPETTPEASSDIADREARLREALEELPGDQRDLIKRSFFLDMPHSEIARDLTMPLGTVKSRIRLAMKRLRLRLDDLS